MYEFQVSNYRENREQACMWCVCLCVKILARSDKIRLKTGENGRERVSSFLHLKVGHSLLTVLSNRVSIQHLAELD